MSKWKNLIKFTCFLFFFSSSHMHCACDSSSVRPLNSPDEEPCDAKKKPKRFGVFYHNNTMERCVTNIVINNLGHQDNTHSIQFWWTTCQIVKTLPCIIHPSFSFHFFFAFFILLLKHIIMQWTWNFKSKSTKTVCGIQHEDLTLRLPRRKQFFICECACMNGRNHSLDITSLG